MFTFVIGRCHLVTFPSLANGSSVSATAGSTAGTDIFESRGGRSAIVPYSRRRPGNDALRGLLSGLCVVTVRPGFVSCYGTGEEVLDVHDFNNSWQINTRRYFCMSVTTEAQTSRRSAACSRTSLQFAGMFRKKDLTCQLSQKL